MRNLNAHHVVAAFQKRNINAQLNRAAGRPAIGIFWVLPGNEIIAGMTELESAVDYGNFKVSPYEHYSYWEDVQRYDKNRTLALRDDYDYWPRGRVMYNTSTRRFQLLADKQIVYNKALLSKVMREFSLPRANTDVGLDSHYKATGNLGGDLVVPDTQKVYLLNIVYEDGEDLSRQVSSPEEAIALIEHTYGSLQATQAVDLKAGKTISLPDGDSATLHEKAPTKINQPELASKVFSANLFL